MRRRLQRDDQPADEWFDRLMQHVCVAGSCRAYAMSEPDAAPGLIRAAEHHSAMAGAMMRNAMSAHGPYQENHGRSRATGLGQRPLRTAR